MKAITMYSTTISFSVLLLLIIVSPASASDEYPWPEEYTILCSSEQATGFSWVNGNWKKQNFKNIQRLIMKSNKNNCVTGSEGEIDWGFNVHSKDVCLNERPLGTEYESIQSRYCEEHYIGPSNSEYAPRTNKLYIYCDHPKMFLDPNGWYHYAHIVGDTEDAPENDIKDSQYIEVGKCSMIEP
jgi:hypothetical protein